MATQQQPQSQLQSGQQQQQQQQQPQEQQVNAPQVPPAAGATPVTTSCHCGRVTVTLPSTPERINECQCSICYRYGALWAYYRRRDVVVSSSSSLEESGAGILSYLRSDDEANRDITFNLCAHCGCLTHWLGVGDSEKRVGPDAKMGVNVRMLPKARAEACWKRVSHK